MRSLAIATLTGLSILAAAPATAGGQSRGGSWGDTPTMALNMPGRATAAPPAPAAAWHGHDAYRPASPQRGGAWQNGSWQGGDRQEQWQGERHDISQRGGATGWQSPGRGNRHGGYNRPYRGYRLDRVWLQPGYAIGNWDFYGLGQPGYGRHWVRYYDDAVLIDGGGTVYDTIEGMDWDRSGYAADVDTRSAWSSDAHYATDAKYGGMAPGSYYAPSAPVAQPAPPVAYAQPAAMYAAPVVTYGSSVAYVAPAVSTVVVQSAPVVTTTTTTTTFVEEVYRAPVRHWAPRPVHRAPRRVSCCCLCR